MEISVIHITVTGKCQVGKSSVLGSIRDLLQDKGYCVAFPDRAERRNPSDNLTNAKYHEKPKMDSTVFILTESTI